MVAVTMRRCLGEILCLYLLSCSLAGAGVRINELLGNPRDFGSSEGIPDPEAGPDNYGWIEITNTGTNPVDLGGWHLTDNSALPMKWTFPNPTNVSVGEHLVVLASGLTTTDGAFLHLPFKLSAKGEYLAITDATGATIDQLTPEFPKQFLDYSYGRDATDSFVYFDAPTPGASNAASGLIDRVDRPDFSLDAGFYEGTVSVSITSTTPTATIRYTTDGSVPTETNGTDYTAALTFSDQSVATIRARAFRNDYIDSRVATATYLMNQPDGIKALPAISLVGEPDDYFAPDGILANPTSSAGRENEKPTSFEFIHKDNVRSPGQVDLGVRIVNNNSDAADLLPPDLWKFSNWRRPKFNLFLRSDYEAGTWDYDLFPLSKVKNIDRLRIRLGYQDYPNPFIIDEFSRQMFVRMGYVNAVGLIVGLYQNGIFRAHVNLVERHRENFFQESYDSDFEWDVRHNTGESNLSEGDAVAWNLFENFLGQQDLTDPSKYAEILTMIDMTNFVDYILLNTYTGARDWPQNNNDISRERSPDGLWRFHIWDNENSIGLSGDADFNINIFNSLDRNFGDIAEVWQKLSNLDEFKLHYADRVQHHMFNDGPMVESNMDELWNELSDELTPFLKFWNEDPEAEVNHVFGEWAAFRRPIYFGHLQGKGLWPTTEAPSFSQHGGPFVGPTDISINNPNGSGTIYFTTDGSDPRVIGGAVSGTATAHSAAVTISTALTLKARVVDSGEWSPIVSADFFAANPPSLRVTELMYHPSDPTAAEVLAGVTDADLFEFIEVRNIGASTLDLAGVAFKGGVSFDFEDASVGSLAAGERALLVRDPVAFTLRYGAGLPVIGTYMGGLKNSSEAITITAAVGVTVLDFTYDDSWYPTTDGEGFSLEIIDDSLALSTWALSGRWQPSDSTGGSPGTDASGVLLPPNGSIVINEVLTHSDGPEGDWIELHNTTGDAIDIGGWFLSDDPGTPLKYEIAASTTLAANAYMVFNARDHFGPASADPGMLIPFGLSEKGDEVVVSSGSGGAQTGYQEQESFAGADNGVTFGRHTLSDANVVFTTLETRTQGGLNSGPLVGPVVISEINYHPVFAGYEYIKILNAGASAVPLYDVAVPANTWQITNGVDFTFPHNVTLAAGTHLVLVPFEPDASPFELSNFVSLYGIGTGVEILGPYSGGLSNGGERVSLSKAGMPDPVSPNEVPLIVVDSVKYNDVAPWPTGPDGRGEALARQDATVIGDEPTNWQGIVTRVAPEGNADLVSLALSTGTLAPSFDPNTFSYTAHVAYAIDNMTVVLTAADAGATIEVRVNGGGFMTVNSGTSSGALALSEGANTIEVRVTSMNAMTMNTYGSVITRLAPSNNASLADLVLSEGTLSPAFVASTVDYDASVAHTTTSITLTPTSAVSVSTLEVRVNSGAYSSVTSGSASGSLDLDVGDNDVEIKVTAEDGTTVRMYAVTVNRAASGNTDLSGLVVSEGSLSPEFSGGVTSYDVAVGTGVASMMVTATSEELSASLEIRINGSAYASITSGVASDPLGLDPGNNVIDVRVTAADTVTQHIYTISVIRVLRVTTLIDEDDGIGSGGVSLREALGEPNAVIGFDPSLDGGTIILTEGRITIEKSVLIDASSLPQGIRISGNEVSGVMKVRQGFTITLDRVSIVNGMTNTSNGAGIENDGDLTLVDLEIAGNTTVSGRGGGIFNKGTLRMERVAVVGNMSHRGGGLYNGKEAIMAVVIDSTFVGNQSNRGGAISHRAGDLELVNATISSNVVAMGDDGSGGIYFSAPLTLENSIVAGNIADNEPDIGKGGGSITSRGANIIGVNEGVEAQFPAGALVGTMSSPVDPGLFPIGYYGGLTRTMKLMDGGLAIDNGVVTGQTPEVDQRGMARVFGSALDIGAYEAGEPDGGYDDWIAERLPLGSDLASLGDFDSDGIPNLREYGFRGDPTMATLDPQTSELVTNGNSGESHLLLVFPHVLDALDVVFEVRAASDVFELVDGGDHIVIYRFEDGSMTVDTGFVSRDDGVSPPVLEVIDTQSTTANQRRFLQLMTILK